MTFFVKAISGPKPKTKESQQIAYAYALLLVVVLFCQLFTFDDFLPLIENLWLPGGEPTAHLLGGIIVVSELFSLPFLLGVRLSPLMRVFCMIASWLVPTVWLFISVWLQIVLNNVSNIGFLGTVVDILPGWWAIFACIAIGVLSAWSSWGLWPLKRMKPGRRRLK